MTDLQRIDLAIFEQQERKLRARTGLKAFQQYLYPNRTIYKHDEVFCYYLNKFARKEIPRLMIFAPPQHHKSEHSSRLTPSFILGRNPDDKILTISYGQSLASDFNTDVQKIMDSPEYQRLFPGSFLGDANIRTLSGKPKRNSDMFEIVNHKGLYVCAGFGGSVTGKGFHWIIIDDLVKSRAEADSQTYRDSTEEAYEGTIYPRRNSDQTSILILNTRWHEDDICGRLLKKAKDNPREDQWVVLSLPRICENPNSFGEFRQEGEVLWPEGFSLEDALNQRGRSNYEWRSQQQQDPRAREGNLIKYAWIAGEGKIVDTRPMGQGVRRCRYWDLAGSERDTADYTAGVLLGLSLDKLAYVEDVQRGQWSILQGNNRILQTAKDDRLWCQLHGMPEPQIWIEKPIGRGGSDMEAELRKLLMGFPVNFDPPRGSKESRALSAGGFVSYAEGGNMRICRGEWNHEYIEELTSFPSAKHDDMFDGTSGSFNKLALPPPVNYFGMN